MSLIRIELNTSGINFYSKIDLRVSKEERLCLRWRCMSLAARGWQPRDVSVFTVPSAGWLHCMQRQWQRYLHATAMCRLLKEL